jgi:hypothetical protein
MGHYSYFFGVKRPKLAFSPLSGFLGGGSRCESGFGRCFKLARRGKNHVSDQARQVVPKHACAFIHKARVHKARAWTREDVIALSGALGLGTTGTVSELSALIKAYPTVHLEVQHNPFFSVHFVRDKWHCVDSADSIVV